MLPIYVVSLKHDVEKRKIIENKLNSLQVTFEFVDAVYGKDLPKEFISQLNLAGEALERGYKPAPGEVGCTFSHLKVYQLMLERKQNWACILEDDVILDHRMQDFYINFDNCRFESVNDNLYLMGGQNGISANILVAKSIFSFFYIGKQKFSKIINSEQYVCRTCCYFISAKLAKKLIDLSSAVFLLADDWEYLVKNTIIANIYLANFVDHPKDLSSSVLERERKAAQKEAQMTIKRKSFPIKVVRFLAYKTIFYLKAIIAQVNRFKR
ncbi:glycosyltransferase family 25 protein [Entomomonas asaccharolytica]|uniref:Glycosyltransferase family 25 protein n=1 Tax=Entomomonas asaccharolytica TaxID=2785331 RepID=A0A974RYW5_9GAMM|nr:glycosyltransferase family 25 protein [Entomomonas asaccharolytica]QQP86389.1 glycosyltransferase family 25 protein [Entomomonas asaccharolytica]